MACILLGIALGASCTCIATGIAGLAATAAAYFLR